MNKAYICYDLFFKIKLTMKTLLTIFGIVLIMITSCQKSSLSPDTSTATGKKPMVSSTLQNTPSNGVFVLNTHADIDLATPGSLQVDACTGESLQVTSGTLHLDFHETINNNIITFEQHSNIQNYKLVGVSSGAQYTGNSTSVTKNQLSLNNGVFLIAETMSSLLTTPGRKNNPRIKFILHLTFNAQGTLTAFVDSFTTSCE
jgi:hypothetical protein